jgi:AraC family transcriptional regulator
VWRGQNSWNGVATHRATANGNPQPGPKFKYKLAWMKRLLAHASPSTLLQDELSLVELSRIARLSPHHFATAFKASTGKSPHRYVIERRVDRARDLLLRKEETISEIAIAVGFSSQSHLTANFRRTTGMTPRKFRQSLD